jgi:nitrate reductase beta subunit
MLPVQAMAKDGLVGVGGNGDDDAISWFGALEQARLPLRYMARLFTAGNEEEVAAVYRKLIAVRVYKRGGNATGAADADVARALAAAKLTAEEAEAIFELTATPTFDERFVIPPLAREVNIEATVDPLTRKADTGFGFRRDAKRGQ